MPTNAQLRLKLINKLGELFQLNQPDLDFGFYVTWCDLTNNLEECYVTMNAGLKKTCKQHMGKEFNINYVNCGSNLLLMEKKEEYWAVNAIEGKFFQSIWETEDV